MRRGIAGRIVDEAAERGKDGSKSDQEDYVTLLILVEDGVPTRLFNGGLNWRGCGRRRRYCFLCLSTTGPTLLPSSNSLRELY